MCIQSNNFRLKQFKYVSFIQFLERRKISSWTFVLWFPKKLKTLFRFSLSNSFWTTSGQTFPDGVSGQITAGDSTLSTGFPCPIIAPCPGQTFHITLPHLLSYLTPLFHGSGHLELPTGWATSITSSPNGIKHRDEGGEWMAFSPLSFHSPRKTEDTEGFACLSPTTTIGLPSGMLPSDWRQGNRDDGRHMYISPGLHPGQCLS